MWSALRKVNLEDKVRSLGGLDSHINYNGNNLSGGENQRLSLARTILSTHPVLLLDEPSSAMDVNLEREIFQEILNLNKTSIIVAHKLKTIPRNSRLLFIKGGESYTLDTLEGLLNNDEEFKKLYHLNEN